MERINSANSSHRNNQMNSSSTGLREGERLLNPNESGFE